jgi:hypothetical protein
MLELNEETMPNAIDRAFEEGAKVRQIKPGLISVPCSSGAHPAGHLAEIERRADGSLWGRCWVGENQGCPAELSHRPCWHLAAAVALFSGLEAMTTAADRDGTVERAVRFDGPMPPPRARGPWDGRLVCKRTHKGPLPEGDPEAVLVAPPIVKKGKVERVRGFQI